MIVSPALVELVSEGADEHTDETSRIVFNASPMAKKASIASQAVTATIGSLLAEAVLFPVDTVRLQVQTAPWDRPRGFFATMAGIISKRGAGGLYSGLSGAMVKECVHSMNFWLWHGFLFRCVAQFDETTATHPTQKLILNLIAKQLNWLCTVPFEVISSSNQLAPDSPGFLATAAALYQQHGFGVFYRGLSVSLLLAINPAIMNMLITSMLRAATTVKQHFGAEYHEARDHNAGVQGFVIAIAKALATVLTYPLIRAKVLQQTQTSGPAVALRQVLSNTVAAEGIGGLYRGVLSMSFKTVLWNCLMMGFKHLLGGQRVNTSVVSPPRTPLGFERVPMMPLMAREPFPAELVTAEKLNEIVGYVRHSDSSPINSKRVGKIEVQLDNLAGDVRMVKDLLSDLVAAQHAENGAGSLRRRVNFTD